MERPAADDLWLLLLDELTGRPLVPSANLRIALGGAVLLDLALRGRLAVEPSRWGAEKIRVADPAPTGDAVLDGGLSRLAVRPVATSSAVNVVVDGELQAVLRKRLVVRGVVRHEPGAFLKLTRDHPDRTVRAHLVGEVAQALAGRTPPQHAAALVVLVNSVGVLPRVVPGHGLTKKALRARVEELSASLGHGEFATKAVAASVRSATDAVTAVLDGGACGGDGGGDGGGGGD